MNGRVLAVRVTLPGELPTSCCKRGRVSPRLRPNAQLSFVVEGLRETLVRLLEIASTFLPVSLLFFF